MRSLQAELILEITAVDRRELDRELERAEKIAMTAATKDRDKGILITRNSQTSFTVRLSDEVPYGVTQERQA